MYDITEEDFRMIKSWERVDHCIKAITFKFVSNKSFEFVQRCRIDTRNKFAKLKISFRKTNMGQKAISFVGPSLWNSFPELI